MEREQDFHINILEMKAVHLDSGHLSALGHGRVPGFEE